MGLPTKSINCGGCQKSCSGTVDALLARILVKYASENICTDCLLHAFHRDKKHHCDEIKRNKEIAENFSDESTEPEDEEEEVDVDQEPHPGPEIQNQESVVSTIQILQRPESDRSPRSSTPKNPLLENLLKPLLVQRDVRSRRQRNLDDHESVFLTHIESCKRFYLQRKKDLMQLTFMCKRLDKRGNNQENPPLETEPEVGQLLQGLYQQDSKWYRCVPEEPMDQDGFIKVFFVDYGNCGRLRLSELKKLSASNSDTPWFAIECGLANLDRLKDDIDENELQRIFVQLCAIENLELKVVPERGDCPGPWPVTLEIPQTEDVAHDFPFTVQEMLSHLGFMKTTLSLTQLTKPCLEREYKVEQVNKNEKFEAVVLCSHSPKNFFLKNKSKTDDFQDEFNRFYKAQYRNLRIGPFSVGMVVAAKYPEDENYYRARIAQIDNSLRAVTVHYVDFGNSCEVPWENIYKLTNKWIQKPIEAIGCSIYMEGNLGMNEECLEYFYSSVFDDYTFIVEIKNYKSNSNHASVILCSPDNPFVSLNDQLQRLLKKEVVQDEEEAVQEEEEENGGDGSTVSRFESLKSILKTKSDDENHKERKRPFVVTNVESPSEIYVRPKVMDEEFLKFQEEMRQFFLNKENVVEPLKEFEVGIYGCYESVGTYHRVKIVSNPTKDNKLTVQRIDTGSKANINSNSLLKLPEALKSKAAFCHCVRLHNVVPLGKNDGTWSLSAIEFTRKLLKAIKTVLVVIKGPIEKSEGEMDKLPVSIFTVEYVAGGAFDPEERTETDLAEKLKNEGFLMFRKRGDSGPDDSSEKEIDDSILASIGKDAPKESSAILDVTDLIANEKEVEGFSWIRPSYPKAQNRDGVVTFVDEAGQFYISTPPQIETKKKIESEISFVMNSRNTEEIFNWKVGDIGVARYPPEFNIPGWFRMQVTEILPENESHAVMALFVDYGEQKTLYLEEMSRQIPKSILDVPIQVMRCKLDNIVPVASEGKYEQAFLEQVHIEVVDKKVKITYTGSKTGYENRFPIPVELNLAGKNLDLGDYFLKKGAARKCQDPQKWLDDNIIKFQETAGCFIQPTTK